MTSKERESKKATQEPLLSEINEEDDHLANVDVNFTSELQGNNKMYSGILEDLTDESSSESEMLDNANLTSNFETMINLLKANIGTGILAMPDAFKNIGLVAGLAGMFILGVLCVHCQHMLLACGKDICSKLKVRTLTYAEIAENSFKLGPGRLKRYSTLLKRCVNFFLILTQLGFCSVYFVFIATNITKILNNYTSGEHHIHVIMAIILPFMIVYTFIKSLKALAPISMLANILQFIGLFIIFYCISQDVPPVSSRPFIADYSTWPLFYGTAIYTFEGIGMVLPLENKMKNPDDFRGCTGVLNTGMIIVACLFCAVGFYGYLKFGSAVAGSITLNLPPHILYESVKIMFAISVFITYSLMLYVPVGIIWPTLSKFTNSPKLRNFGNYGFRTFLVLFTFGIAELIPHLDIVIALVGALGSSSLALIFPPIIEMATFYPNRYGRCNWILFKDIFLCLFGLFGFFIGTYATVSHALLRSSP